MAFDYKSPIGYGGGHYNYTDHAIYQGL